MSHYKSNLRDIFFNLFEVLGRDEVLGHGPYEDMDHDTAVAVLTEIERLATTKLASSYVDGDRNPPVYDPATEDRGSCRRRSRRRTGLCWTPASTSSSCRPSSAGSPVRPRCSGPPTS